MALHHVLVTLALGSGIILNAGGCAILSSLGEEKAVVPSIRKRFLNNSCSEKMELGSMYYFKKIYQQQYAINISFRKDLLNI